MSRREGYVPSGFFVCVYLSLQSRGCRGILSLRLFLPFFLEFFASSFAVESSLAPVRPMAIVILTGATEPSYREKGNQGQCPSIDELPEPKGQDEADHPRSQ